MNWHNQVYCKEDETIKDWMSDRIKTYYLKLAPFREGFQELSRVKSNKKLTGRVDIIGEQRNKKTVTGVLEHKLVKICSNRLHLTIGSRDLS